MAKITGTVVPFELDKRFYIPGIFIEDNCPNCGELNKTDLSDSYLSYPEVNTPYTEEFCCYNCECPWEVKVIVRVSLELATTEE